MLQQNLLVHHAWPAPLVGIIAGSILALFEDTDPVAAKLFAHAGEQFINCIFIAFVRKCLFKSPIQRHYVFFHLLSPVEVPCFSFSINAEESFWQDISVRTVSAQKDAICKAKTVML